MIGVKICGINSPAAYRAADASGARWAGFVFHPPSPRAVSPAFAAATAGGRLENVALLVNPTDAELTALLAVFRPDALQLHDVAPARARAIKTATGLPVWRAVGVDDQVPTLPSADALAGCDRLLLDAKPAADAVLPGGNGRAFDWRMIAGWQPGFPWMLAGGLTPGNVAVAIRQTGAQAVDVSSGVESAPGQKDPARIHAFVAAALSQGGDMDQSPSGAAGTTGA